MCSTLMKRHAASFIRCYPLPEKFSSGFFATKKRGPADSILTDLLDVRYAQRERIVLGGHLSNIVNIKHVNGKKYGKVDIEVFFYIHKSNTLIILILFKNIPNIAELTFLLQKCRPGNDISLYFNIHEFDLNFWQLYDWFAINFCRNYNSANKKSSGNEVLSFIFTDSVRSNIWSSFLKEEFKESPLFSNPCIFGCLSYVGLESLKKNEHERNVDDFLNNSESNKHKRFRFSDKVCFLIKRNSGYYFEELQSAQEAKDDLFLFKVVSLQIGILLVVRHLLIQYGQTAAVISDHLLDDKKASAHDFFKQVSDLKSCFVFFQDELNNLSLWNSPELVTSSRFIRSESDWAINEDLKSNQDRVIDLLALTESISRTQTSSSRKFISVVLAVVSVLNLMQLIPIFSEHIFPHIAFIGPPLSLILIITALIAFKIHKNA
jgi:hypothetical protein